MESLVSSANEIFLVSRNVFRLVCDTGLQIGKRYKDKF